MSNITTFGAFNTARLGIYVSSRALDVVGNNIANINTVGYSRQKVDIGSLYLGGSDRYVSKMDHRVGQGAFTMRMSQYRDPYLDIRYRNETTRVNEAEERLNFLDQLKGIIDEVAMGNDGDNDGKGILEAQFSDLITQMNNLVTEGAGQDGYDSLVRGSAESLCRIIRQKANDLEELREKEEKRFYEETLPEVNSILSQIQNLSSSIRKSQIYGGDALELRDQRNTLIDQLSGFMKIEVTYDEEHVGDDLMVERLNIRQPETGAYLIKGVYASSIEKDDLVPPEEEGGYPMPLRFTALTNLQGEVLRNEPYETIVGSIPAVAHGIGDDDDDVINESAIGTAEEMKAFLEANLSRYKDLFPTQTYLDGELRNEKYIIQLQPVKNHGEMDEDGVVYGDNKVEFTGENLLKIDGLEGVEIQFNMPDDMEDMDEEHYDWVIYRYSPPVYPVQIKDDALTGSLQSDREMLTEEGEYSMKEDVAYDKQAGVKRGIPYYQKALNTLAQELARVMNEANVIPDQDLYYVEKGPDGKPMTGADGGLKYIDPKTGEEVDAKDRVMVEGFQSWYKGGALFSNNSNGNDTEGINAFNISVSLDWQAGRTRIVQSTDPKAGSTANDNLKHMLVLLTEKHNFCSDTDREGVDPYFTGSFQEMFSNNMSSILGLDIQSTERMLANYMQLQDDIYVKRESVSGVDLNDEAANLMQYQKSYAAACRLMTTVDEMLDKLINGTAV